MRAALIQLNSSDDPAANLPAVMSALKTAADGGADWALTPEVTNCVSASRSRQREVLRTEADDAMLAAVQTAAAELKLNVLIGSLALKSADENEDRFLNRSFLIDAEGEITARYDKIHMFDVEISKTETYRESSGYRPGEQAVLGQINDVPIGMTICYDLRFPGLYRDLSLAGAKILTVPSAFSPVTGAAHWETLLRARAIETGSYVLAPAQTGAHAASHGRARETYGHSLAVDPWGKVLCDGGTEPGVSFVELDLSSVDDCRRRLPSLSHGRTYEGPNE
ncbi:MAG: carbon-nitrogen hydrolase family protein [Pseudomonadota bacterium]